MSSVTPNAPSMVIIADDHPVWRAALRELLPSSFKVVAEAGDGPGAVELALAIRPDIVVMDMRMPGMSGVAATRVIKERLPDTAVVMVTASGDDRDIREAIQAGVSGYIGKDAEPTVIVEALLAVAAGGAYLPPHIAHWVLHGIRTGDARMSKTALSVREADVFRLLADGCRHKEIARALCISPRTVNNHVARIYDKLGLDDRAQAIVYAIKNGMISL